MDPNQQRVQIQPTDDDVILGIRGKGGYNRRINRVFMDIVDDTSFFPTGQAPVQRSPAF